MNNLRFLTFLLFAVCICSVISPGFANQEKPEAAPAPIVWDVNNVKSIGGHKTTVLGSPKVIDTDKGKAVEFDGIKNGLIVDALPLAGAEKFTLEVIFRPDANGPKEQRFVHLQENASDCRMLIETRLTGKNLWYLDTYIQSAKGKQTLIDAVNVHPVGQWYSAALVYDGQEMRHYVNGVKELSEKPAFSPLGEGKTSLGVRINQVHWFKGAIRQVRFTKKALDSSELLKPENPKDDVIVWDVNNLNSIGGNEVAVTGAPKVIETEKGKAVQFNGVRDGLILETIPLAGAEKFTIEVIFRPEANGLPGAQRFLHIQENNSKNRILIIAEVLPPSNDKWYLDTYTRSTKGNQNLFKPALTHKIGKWYNAALVCDGQEIRHYLNGVKEAAGKLDFSPLDSSGKTAIGMKLDKTSWFKGSIYKIKFTKRPLEPKEFLRP